LTCSRPQPRRRSCRCCNVVVIPKHLVDVFGWLVRAQHWTFGTAVSVVHIFQAKDMLVSWGMLLGFVCTVSEIYWLLVVEDLLSFGLDGRRGLPSDELKGLTR
jgi:hypothetical protein